MLLPDESNTDASRRSIVARQHKLSVFNELVRVICSKTARLQLPPKLLDTHAYTKLSSLTLLNPAGTPSLRFLAGSKTPLSLPPNPTMYKGKNEEDTRRFGDPQPQSN